MHTCTSKWNKTKKRKINGNVEKIKNKNKSMQISKEGIGYIYCTIAVQELHDVFENTPLSNI
jgi:hypothetical protein